MVGVVRVRRRPVPVRLVVVVGVVSVAVAVDDGVVLVIPSIRMGTSIVFVLVGTHNPGI